METLSQREFRNDSARIMRRVRNGESFRIASRGTPIAVLSPAENDPLDDLTLREGTTDMSFPPGVHVSESTDDVLTELRGDR